MSFLNKPLFSTSSLPLTIGPSKSDTKFPKSESYFSDFISPILSNDPSCGSCEEGSQATSKCADCSEMLCDPCVRAHQRVRITKDHRIERIINDLHVPITTSGSLGSSSGASSSPCNAINNYCDIHREPHRYYCETCSNTTCNDCNLMDPCGHQLTFINEAIENARKINPKLKTEIYAAITVIRGAIDNVQVLSDNMEMLSIQAVSEIRNVFRKCTITLEERQRELLSHVEQIRQVKGEMLVQQMNKLRLTLSKLLRTSDLLSESMDSINYFEVISAKEKANCELNQLKSLHTQLIPLDDANIIFIPPDNTFLRILSSAGCVTSTTKTSPQKPAIKDLFPYLPSICEAEIFKNGVKNQTIYGSKGPIVVKNPNHMAIQCFGSEGEFDGQLCRPWGICCNQFGQIVVADRSNNRIQIFNSNGTFHHKFGGYGSEPGEFDRPAGVACNPNGDIIVADKDNHRIQVFKIDGTFLLTFGEKGSRNGQFNYPWDVACNSQGQIVVSDTRNHRIQLFSAEGEFLRKYGFESVSSMWKHFDSPRGVCFTPAGSIIVTDFNNHRLVVIDSKFMQAQFLGQEGSNCKQFLRPQGVVCDDEGNIIVSDSRNNRVQVFESNGNFLWKIGQSGKGIGDLDRPSGVCLNPEGRIIVVDFGNNRVQIF